MKWSIAFHAGKEEIDLISRKKSVLNQSNKISKAVCDQLPWRLLTETYGRIVSCRDFPLYASVTVS